MTPSAIFLVLAIIVPKVEVHAVVECAFDREDVDVELVEVGQCSLVGLVPLATRCAAGLPQQVWHHTSHLPRSP